MEVYGRADIHLQTLLDPKLEQSPGRTCSPEEGNDTAALVGAWYAARASAVKKG